MVQQYIFAFNTIRLSFRRMNDSIKEPSLTSLFQTGQQPSADIVEITYFTDPLCCWSWALEPQWQRLLFEYDGHIARKYVMGGLLPEWDKYEDTVNFISRPAQMGPLWMQASHISGMPMASTIWHTDPPVSSYSACIAVKCAELQSPAAGERYLRLLRESLMLHSRNISRQEVLVETAQQLAGEIKDFDLDKFEQDLVNGTGLEAFRTDLHAVQIQNIERFPALLFRRNGHRSVMLTGYKPYEILLEAFQQVATGIQQVNSH